MIPVSPGALAPRALAAALVLAASSAAATEGGGAAPEPLVAATTASARAEAQPLADAGLAPSPRPAALEVAVPAPGAIIPPAPPPIDLGPAPSPAAAAPSGACYPAGRDHLACYEYPRLWSFLANTPRDIGGMVADAFRRENLPAVAGVALSTAGLVMMDQDLVDGAKDVARGAGIGEGNMKKVPVVPIPYPTDAGSALYYIGDGMVPVLVTVGMLGYGLVTTDARVLQTTSQLTEGLLSVGIVAQTIKHATGRQSPSRATEPGGRWDLLPNQRDYMKNVPAFDAFPSGHMATAMVTVTVLAENYPEYWLIRPVGYTLMAALGFQMLNGDVHWASDYPLAVAIGYSLGKHAVANGRRLVPLAGAEKPAGSRVELELLPLPLAGGGGVVATGRF